MFEMDYIYFLEPERKDDFCVCGDDHVIKHLTDCENPKIIFWWLCECMTKNYTKQKRMPK